MKTLKIAPLSAGVHAKLFDERKNMLVPHLTSSNSPLNLVKHLADPADYQIFMFTKTNPLYPTSSCHLTWQQFYCIAETASGRDLTARAWDPQTLSGMEMPLGCKNSHPVMCICQDYPIFFTKLSQSVNEVQQQVKMGRGNGTHHSQGDHRWSCPHSWVPLKCSADQSSFIAVPQQTFLYHETIP